MYRTVIIIKVSVFNQNQFPTAIYRSILTVDKVGVASPGTLSLINSSSRCVSVEGLHGPVVGTRLKSSLFTNYCLVFFTADDIDSEKDMTRRCSWFINLKYDHEVFELRDVSVNSAGTRRPKLK